VLQTGGTPRLSHPHASGGGGQLKLKRPKQKYCCSSQLVLWSTRSDSGSEVYDGLADGEVALHGPRQAEELGRDELEDLVHVDVVRCAREEEGRLHRSCVCTGLTEE
jgi:hypothetical protein